MGLIRDVRGDANKARLFSEKHIRLDGWMDGWMDEWIDAHGPLYGSLHKMCARTTTR